MSDFLPVGVSLEQVLGQHFDGPLPNLAGFDRLDADKLALTRLVDWVEPQSVCDTLLKWHGAAGLHRVLAGIARDASRKGVHMPDRIASYAASMGLTVH
jgi:hypothetical protein